MNAAIVIIAMVAGALFCLSAQAMAAMWGMYRNTNKLPPKPGHTIVTRRNGDQHYRELPKSGRKLKAELKELVN